MLSFKVSTVVSLLAASLAAAFPVELEARDGCNADNVLRLFRSSQNIADSLVFCSAFLGVPAVTVTATTVGPASTVSASITDFTTITSTSTYVTFDKRATGISTPPYIASSNIPDSRISSACQCLTIPVASATVTVTSTPIVTVTQTLHSTATVVQTATSTQSHVYLANPTTIAGSAKHDRADYDQDDTYYPINLPFSVSAYGFASTEVLISVNGFLWLNNFAIGEYQQFYTDDGTTPLPKDNSQLPDIAILPFWADLIIRKGTFEGLFYEITGATGTRQVTFEYYVSTIDDENVRYHFAVKFFENKPNVVQFLYYNVPDSTLGTVGTQQDSAGKASTFSRFQTKVTNGLIVTIDTSSGAITTA